MRIALLSGNSLSNNPRVAKEAAALTEAGHDVRVLGAWSTEQGAKTDMKVAARGGYTFVPLLPPNTPEGQLHRLLQRVARKVMPWSKWTFGLMPLVLRREAERAKPGLAIAHSEPALFAALDLHGLGVRVGVDMEDWFSEDLPTESRRSRPVAALRRAERQLLRCAVHATCTTEVMADALASEYGCPRPVCVYNVFPKPPLPDPVEFRDRSPLAKSMDGTSSRGCAVRSIHWFSQTIGPGRGLEDLFAATATLRGEFEIHLRGNLGGYGKWLDSVVQTTLRDKVFVHGTVPSEELPGRIAEHDIGFAGEISHIRNKDLTASNKIFQYLQSGLAVVASKTRGQEEVTAKAPRACLQFPSGDRQQLFRQLKHLVSDQDALKSAKAEALVAAQKTFNWEKEKGRLISQMAQAVGRPVPQTIRAGVHLS